MHPRNRYAVKPDFTELAQRYAWFAKHVQDKRVDWTDREAVKNVTRVLLLDDFGIVWDMPLDRLCPPVTNRLNYIHWVEDLLALTAPANPERTKRVTGIDIGTGSSCIYPLLGVALHENWHFVATDIDSKSLEFAAANLSSNVDHQHRPLHDRVKLHLVQDPNDKLVGAITRFQGKVAQEFQYDFCMCNPPFFDSEKEQQNHPEHCCAATRNESVTPGGEAAFLEGIVEDSLKLRKQVCWYTSMVGRKGTLKTILKKLREQGITNTRTTEFIQGKTSRWGIAWSYFDFGEQQLRVVAGDDPAAGRAAAAVVKVLGKRKEAARRNVCMFDVKEPLGTTRHRLCEFLDAHKTATNFQEQSCASSDHLSAVGQVRTQPRAGRASEFSFAVTVTGEGAGNGAGNDGGGCCSVEVTLQAGTGAQARKEFWTFCDLMKRDVVREGRKWRRQQKKLAQRQEEKGTGI